MYFPHDLFCHGVLMLALAFWQVHERHLVGLGILQGIKYLCPVELIQPGHQALYLIQLAVRGVNLVCVAGGPDTSTFLAETHCIYKDVLIISLLCDKRPVCTRKFLAVSWLD